MTPEPECPLDNYEPWGKSITIRFVVRMDTGEERSVRDQGETVYQEPGRNIAWPVENREDACTDLDRNIESILGGTKGVQDAR